MQPQQPQGTQDASLAALATGLVAVGLTVASLTTPATHGGLGASLLLLALAAVLALTSFWVAIIGLGRNPDHPLLGATALGLAVIAVVAAALLFTLDTLWYAITSGGGPFS